MKPFIANTVSGNKEVNNDITTFAFTRSKLTLYKMKREDNSITNVDMVPDNRIFLLISPDNLAQSSILNITMKPISAKNMDTTSHVVNLSIHITFPAILII